MARRKRECLFSFCLRLLPCPCGYLLLFLRCSSLELEELELEESDELESEELDELELELELEELELLELELELSSLFPDLYSRASLLLAKGLL